MHDNETLHSVVITMTTGNLEAEFFCSKDVCEQCRELRRVARYEPWTYYQGPEVHSLHNGIVTLKYNAEDDCTVWTYGASFHREAEPQLQLHQRQKPAA